MASLTVNNYQYGTSVVKQNVTMDMRWHFLQQITIYVPLVDGYRYVQLMGHAVQPFHGPTVFLINQGKWV